MIKIGEHIIKPTIFPDGTSQVFKLPFELTDTTRGQHEVEWVFENESEVFHICQLGQLLYNCNYKPVLKCDYLPYARQDKEITNQSTFALTTFLELVSRFYQRIECIDMHNPNYFSEKIYIANTIPNERIKEVIDACKPDIICFPDSGASKRGYDTQELPVFSLSKNRDQLTGQILGLKCDLPLDLRGKSVLILDDLCDAGGTFMQASKLLREMGAEKVYLYTTHGLYTKGTKLLFDAGLDRIFNYKEEVK